MDKIKLLTITVIGLVVVNLGTLGFLFLNGQNGNRSPRQEDRREPKEIILKKLHFDANQQKEYAKLIDWHKGEIRKLDGNIRKSKKELYSQLLENEVNVKTKDSLITLLNSYQKQIEETHFKHFEDIKKLCHPNQLEDFNDLTEELGRIFSPNKPPKPRND